MPNFVDWLLNAKKCPADQTEAIRIHHRVITNDFMMVSQKNYLKTIQPKDSWAKTYERQKSPNFCYVALNAEKWLANLVNAIEFFSHIINDSSIKVSQKND